MELRKIIEAVHLNSLNVGEFDVNTEIRGCYIGDLLSNVMAHAQAGELWLTVQTHQNVVAVGQLLNLGGIVFLEGHLPQEETIEKARKERIPLFSTNEAEYEFVRHLHKLGLERK